ncbi:hypothetical protein Trydic_g12320 [Trypoxylus dichotomus]
MALTAFERISVKVEFKPTTSALPAQRATKCTTRLKMKHGYITTHQKLMKKAQPTKEKIICHHDNASAYSSIIATKLVQLRLKPLL